MRKLCFALLVGLLGSFSIGCGASPQEADTSHLNIDDNAEAQAARKAASAAYENAGRKGPGAGGAPGAEKQQ